MIAIPEQLIEDLALGMGFVRRHGLKFLQAPDGTWGFDCGAAGHAALAISFEGAATEHVALLRLGTEVRLLATDPDRHAALDAHSSEMVAQALEARQAERAIELAEEEFLRLYGEVWSQALGPDGRDASSAAVGHLNDAARAFEARDMPKARASLVAFAKAEGALETRAPRAPALLEAFERAARALSGERPRPR